MKMNFLLRQEKNFHFIGTLRFIIQISLWKLLARKQVIIKSVNPVFNKFNDRITFEESKESGKEYLNASSLVDSFAENLYDGIVIPVSIGTMDGTRRDYLYEKLDLLISSILENGYEIVSLKDLH